MPKRTWLKSAVCREDLIRAALAARTAWILTDIDHRRSTVFLLKRTGVAAINRTLVPRPALRGGCCPAALDTVWRCMN